MTNEAPKPVQIKEGDEVTTVHGEKLKVLAVEEIEVRKNGKIVIEVVDGKPVAKLQKRILAESGGHKCWFPTHMLKSN